MQIRKFCCRLFVHSIADDTELSDVVAQVWRPANDEEEALRLVWEKKLILEERNHSHVVCTALNLHKIMSFSQVI